MNSIKKYVVSNSLQAAEWQNTEIISGNVAQKLVGIKAHDGGDIAMSGSLPPFAGCCARASLTNSTCSYTRSSPAVAWPGFSPPTSRAFLFSYGARRPSKPAC